MGMLLYNKPQTKETIPISKVNKEKCHEGHMSLQLKKYATKVLSQVKTKFEENASVIVFSFGCEISFRSPLASKYVNKIKPSAQSHLLFHTLWNIYSSDHFYNTYFLEICVCIKKRSFLVKDYYKIIFITW